MQLPSGARLGPYEILAPLGAGGLGEVYRARDARLSREVAIKVLPSELSQDRERLARFEQEARAASSLNHPNIVTVHDIGRSDGVFYVAMELVEGKTLRDLSSEGALPVRKILSLAPQIADGLAKAHAAGIIHRDLKPENVMVSKEGFVKILDFGLAKLVLPESGEVSAMPTVGTQTSPGVVMGTLAYMSPEQASGQPLDFRTDQFSLGSMLYELVTGRRPFQEKTGPETLAAIIREEPKPIGELAPTTPPPLRWIIERCLAKEPENRYASTRDLAREVASLRDHLSEVTSGEGALPGLRRHRLRSREGIAWALAAALAAAFALLLALRRPAPLSRLYTSVNPPPGTDFGWIFAPPALSPDGRRVLYGARASDGTDSLWLRAFVEREPQKIPGTEHATYPFWSSDGEAIGFFTWPEGKLKRVGISGASLQVLCNVPEPRGGAWGGDGTILFGTLNGPIYRVSAAGGQPKAVTRIEGSRREDDHRWPHFLPGGRRFLYLARIKGESRNMTLIAGFLDSPEIKVLGKVASTIAYAAPGYLLSTTADRTLVAQPFDVRRLRLFGNPISVAEQVFVAPIRRTAAFSVSPAGILAYEAGTQAERTRLAWYDRSGKKLETVGAAAEFGGVALSPDGTRVVTEETDTQTGTEDLWLHDLVRGTSTRLTFDPADDQSPVWSPDGRQIAFSSSRGGLQTLYVKAVNGATPEEPLLGVDREKSPQDWSPDGRFLLYRYRQIDGHEDLWALPMTGEHRPFSVIQTPFDKGDASFSPDGHSIAYASDESGRFEVYIRAFPGAGEHTQVSTGGGRRPRWRHDAKELFYAATDGQIMAVEIQTQPALGASTPRRLFPNPVPGPFPAYDVSRDGQRFLFAIPDRETPRPPITVVFNWSPEAKR